MKNLADLDPNEIDPDGVGYFDGYGSMPDPENIDHQLLRETNKKVKEKRAELSGVDDTIAKTLEKFVMEKITEDEKNRLETALKEKRNELENEIARLEKQQSLSERSIDRLVDFMGAPVKLWAKADSQLASSYSEWYFQTALYMT